MTSYVAGTPVQNDSILEVKSPYDNRVVGTVTLANASHVEQAIQAGLKGGKALTRYDRFSILDKARQLLIARKDQFAQTISAESGLAIREANYETGRAHDVLLFAAMESLKDDGQIFSCDISPQGKARKIFTLREPVALAVCITPFNHPLNQVVHKLAPALAVGTPVILKPSEKTPLTAILLTELLYEAGLPHYMLSTLLGPTKEIAEPLVKDPRVDIVSFTGSVAVGKHIASSVGYKKVILELGGNDPLIIMEDADMDTAVHLAAKVLLGGKRNGALLEPTVIDNVPRNAQMIVQESFGPLAPILTFKDIDDAIALSNSTAYGLSSGIVTHNMDYALRFIKELKVGTVNINEVPGYRIESSPFGGIKDSGLGIKEGVIEAMKCFTYVKTFSLPW